MFLLDLKNDIALFNWAPFLGRIQTTKLADNKYSFDGSGNFTVNGDWTLRFLKHDILRYVLEIYEDHYIFYRDQNIKLALLYDLNRIESLKAEIINSDSCISDDWDVATDCFDKIKMFEYQLFAAILDGHDNYKKDYFDLRSNVSILNAGEVSEYLEGNYYLLILYGIADDDDYDFIVLEYLYGNRIQKRCY